ncbi:MAG: hypothetical protein QOJ22_1083 [Thermoleophilaceae bacterium]|jgi:hypothetical protein|nr:hypothetical protein [Thermoleophilaceae bacterium]
MLLSRGLAALALTLVLALPAYAHGDDDGGDRGRTPSHEQADGDDADDGDDGARERDDDRDYSEPESEPEPEEEAAEYEDDEGERHDDDDDRDERGERERNAEAARAAEPREPSEPAPAAEPESTPNVAAPREPRRPAPERVPAAVTFREAVTRADAATVTGTGNVAAAASSATPDRAPSQAAKPRSEPISSAKPLPVRAVPRRVRQIVEVAPRELWAALGALALLALALGVSSWITAMRARRLSRQRKALLQEVGLLQSALLPSVPDDVPVSAAYRPADGAAAGGDFYETFARADGSTAMILGGVGTGGRDALARTTFVRYTLRAYVEAGLEPREVVKVGAEALAGHLSNGAALTVAIHEPDTGRFTYACAGHAPPLVVGPGRSYEPVTACAAPPVGAGEPTGFRQTSFTLTAGSRACLYTDGVAEARVDGRPLGVERLEQMLESLPAGAGANELLDAVVETADAVPGDMAACLVEAPEDAPAAGPRVEELEVDERDVGDSLELFLRACGVPLAEVPGVLRQAGEAARREGSATVRVRLNDFRPGVDVVPGNLVRLQEARRAG